MYTFHLENGTSTPLLYKVFSAHAPPPADGESGKLYQGVIPASSEEHRWVYGQNPAFHTQHAAPQLNFMIWSVVQPQAPPLLFTMDASKTNHLTLMCRSPFVEMCSPTTMIFVGKQLE